MRTNERYLSATEAAKALGVSTRTLKFYEQKGLVKPLRSEAGWRAYGTEALTRLHQILALKHMGLELAAIARLLKGSLASLDSVLALQEENLATRQVETYRALDLVRRARSRLSSGEALSVDDLTTLTRETIMDVQSFRKFDAELTDLTAKRFGPAMQNFLSAEDMKLMKANMEKPGATEAVIDAYGSLQAAIKTNDASSPQALEAMRKFRVVQMQSCGGDLDLFERSQRMIDNILAGPKLSPADISAYENILTKWGFSAEFIDFYLRAHQALKAKEAEAARKRAP